MSLAHQAGYATQSISNYERGEWFPSLAAVFILATVLEVSPKDLLFGQEE